LEAVHLITRIKVTPALAESDEISMIERTQGGELANKLAMPILTRAWQMLLKGVGELQAAPMPMKALEMVLIRLIYAGMLPTPEEILQESEKTGQNAPTAQKKTLDSAGHKPAKEPSTEPLTPRAPTIPQNAKHHSDAPQKEPQDTIDTPVAAATDLPVDPNSKEENHDFVALVALMREKGESLLASQCSTFISVVDFAPPSMTLYIDPAAPKDIKACMTRFLNEHTEHTWQIQPAQEKGAPTLKEQQKARESAAIEAITAHNDMQKVLEKCPPHRIIGVNDLQKNETGKDSTL
jgi:DNA polymerase-3 subunit gamma/tau